MPPHMRALTAAVAVHVTCSVVGAPAERTCASRRITVPRAGQALAAAVVTPVVRVADPAGQHHTVSVVALAGHNEAKLVQPAETGQVSAAETRSRASVIQVEVFQMVSVRTSIFARPRPLLRRRRASYLYTLVCEEPDWLHAGRVIDGTLARHGSRRRPSCEWGSDGARNLPDCSEALMNGA